MTAAMTRAQSCWLSRTTLIRQHSVPLGWPLPMTNMSLLAASVQFSWPPKSRISWPPSTIRPEHGGNDGQGTAMPIS